MAFKGMFNVISNARKKLCRGGEASGGGREASNDETNEIDC